MKDWAIGLTFDLIVQYRIHIICIIAEVDLQQEGMTHCAVDMMRRLQDLYDHTKNQFELVVYMLEHVDEMNPFWKYRCDKFGRMIQLETASKLSGDFSSDIIKLWYKVILNLTPLVPGATVLSRFDLFGKPIM